jgi:hypothetical protein
MVSSGDVSDYIAEMKLGYHPGFLGSTPRSQRVIVVGCYSSKPLPSGKHTKNYGKSPFSMSIYIHYFYGHVQ